MDGKYALLVGRILAGLFYVISGANHFMKLETTAGYAASKGVPAPEAAVVVSGILLLFAGLSLLLGFKPVWGILALVVFFVPVTLMMHAFWAVPEAQMQAEMTNFMKNVALLGTALGLWAIPRPWPISVDEALEVRPHEHVHA